MSTANKLTYLNETKTKLKQVLNYVGANLTNEPFRLYSSRLYSKLIDIINNGTGSLYANMPKVIGTGSELSLKNTAEAPMVLELSASESTQNTLLPSDYQQVEYIESSGTQYIDLGISSGYGYKFVTDIMLTTQTSSWQTIVADTNVGHAFGFFIRGDRTFLIYSNNSNVSSQNSLNFYEKYRVEIENFSGNQKFKVGNTTVSASYTDTTFSGNYQIMAWGDSSSDPFKGRMYNFKVYNSSNELLKQFIPCYRKSDNEIGLYDTVNNVFYTNAGTGVFTKGSNVDTPNPEYPQTINVVTGENAIKIESENLFDISNNNYILGSFNGTNGEVFQYSLRTFELNSTGFKIGDSNAFRGYILNVDLLQGDTYKLIYDVNTDSHYAGIAFYNANSFISVSRNLNTSGRALTFTVPSNATICKLIFETSVENFDTIFTNIKLINQEQTFPLSLGSLEFASIGEYADKIFNNIPSNPLYDANLVEGGWYKYKRIGKAILDGTEGWSLNGDSRTLTNAYICTITEKRAGSLNLMANKFVVIGDNVDSERILGRANDSRVEMLLNKDRCDYSVAGISNWLSENDVIIYYQLDTSVKEQITDTTLVSQLNAIENAVSYDDETNISQTNANRPFIISASAISNTMGGEE